MSTAVPPTNAPTPNPPAAPPAASSPPAAAPTSPAPDPWRAPANAPQWAAGKTPEEILGIAQQLEQTLSRVVAGNNPAPPTPPAAAAPQANNNWGVNDDDYVNGAQFRQAAPHVIRQAIGGDLDRLQASIAQTNLESVKRDPNCVEIFQKYGPEVYNRLASVDKSYWNVDNLRTIVNLVKADHVDEIANERASRLATERMETIRSSGAGFPSVPPQSPDNTLQSEKLPADYRERLAKVGMNESTLDEFCRANGMTRQQWFDQFTVAAHG